MNTGKLHHKLWAVVQSATKCFTQICCGGGWIHMCASITDLCSQDAAWSSVQGSWTCVERVAEPLQLLCNGGDTGETSDRDKTDRWTGWLQVTTDNRRIRYSIQMVWSWSWSQRGRQWHSYQCTGHLGHNIQSLSGCSTAHKLCGLGLTVPHFRGYHTEQQKSWIRSEIHAESEPSQ